MLLEYSTSALIGTALRSYIKHSKAEESYRISGRPVLQFSNRSRTNGWYTFLCTVDRKSVV